jgi:membrane peptidoglycan carboxypeptidase
MRALWVHHILQARRIRQAHRRRTFSRRVLRLGMGITLVVALSVVLLSLGLALGYAVLTADLPSIETLSAMLAPNTGRLIQPTRLYDRSGTQVLAALDGGMGARRFRTVEPGSPEAFSPLLVQATLTLHQPDFWTSPGFAFSLDPTPQTLAERLVSDLLLWREPPSLRRALRMRLLAWQAVARFGRAQVLAAYLNSARFGPQIYGAEQAALRYLGKTATDLNPGEVALLLAALESPALNPLDTPEAALERQRQVLERLLKVGVIDSSTYNEARQHPPTLLPRREAPTTPEDAFVAQVQAALAATYPAEVLERGGLRLLTTLDRHLQAQLACALRVYFQNLVVGSAAEAASCAAARELPLLPTALLPPQPGALAGGAIIVDVNRGETLALVEMDAQGRYATALSRRPSGSLLTPFLALAAFARGMSPATLVWDIPAATTEAEVASAARYHGPERLRLALVGDDRAALDKVMAQLGAPTVVQTARALGLPLTEMEATTFLTQGAPLTLTEIAQAYLPFATLGLGYHVDGWPASQPLSVLRLEGSDSTLWLDGETPAVRPLISAQLAYLVHHILGDSEARHQRLENAEMLSLGRPAAVKVGQVEDGQTVWAVGYTPHYLVAVWVGYRAGETGAALSPSLAAGLWQGLMRYLHRDLPPQDWPTPPGITLLNVCDPSGLLPTADCPQVVREVFLSENLPTQYDTLYRRYAVNRETGRLATAFTPPELIEEHVYMVLPPEAATWAAQAGLPLPPTQYDNIPSVPSNPQVHFSQPPPLAYLRGTVTVQGSATAADFAAYRVQVGEGLNPRTWVTLATGEAPVDEGVLATWDTTALPDGVYILRLTLVHRDQRVETALRQVTVDNTPPQVQVSLPRAGETLLRPANGVLGLYAEASDTYGVHRLIWRLDGRVIGETFAPPYIRLWEAVRGEHTLEVTAEDLAGNRATSAEIHFTVR